jgi:thiol-disulfide isomerase/thioredoxin
MRRAWMGLFPLLLILFVIQTQARKQARPEKLGPLVEIPAAPQEFIDLTSEFTKADLGWAVAIQEGKTEAERLKALHTREHLPERYAGRFLELANRYPGDDTAFDAWLWIMRYCPLAPEAQTALQISIRDHLQSQRLESACYLLAEAPSPVVESLLREVISHNTNTEVQALARFALGKVFKSRIYDSAHASDAESQTREAEELFKQVIANDGGVKVDRYSLAEWAKAELFEMCDLAIGKPVPEIEGKDLNDAPMTLSSFRGKVVVLEFWGYWCTICKEIFPHHKELANRFADKPFALVGVNSDVNTWTARQQVQELGVSWPSWWDAGDARGGPIAQRWNVHALPTTYVIDRRGVIRFRFGPRPDSHDPARYILVGSGGVRNKWDQRFDQITQAVETLLNEPAPLAATEVAR